MQNIPNPQDITSSADALDQSIALNKIVMTMLQQQKDTNKRLFIALIISLVMNVIIVCSFLVYESQYEYATTETVTTTTTSDIDQNTGSGSGNNVYQGGKDAVYNQGGGD